MTQTPIRISKRKNTEKWSKENKILQNLTESDKCEDTTKSYREKCHEADTMKAWSKIGPTMPSWKDKRPQFQLCKSMAMYFWTIYWGFNRKIVGKIIAMPS